MTEETSRQRKNHKLTLSGSVFVSDDRSWGREFIGGMLGRGCSCVCAAVEDTAVLYSKGT
jgi:hypothetical protein